MVRMTSGLSRPLLRWSSQVAGSLAATLAATLVWSVVPHPGAVPAVRPELTSGGKFAARAIQPIAYDGLDTMPLPHVAPPPARFVVTAAEPAPPAILHRASWDEAAPAERPARVVRPAHLPVRADARRPEPVPHAAPAAVVPDPEPKAEAEEGVLHRVIPSALPQLLPGIASTARSAWTVTASAGDALVSRVVPLIP